MTKRSIGEKQVFSPIQIKYGVRSKVYLGSCVQLYLLADTPQFTPPRIWAHKQVRNSEVGIDTDKSVECPTPI